MALSNETPYQANSTAGRQISPEGGGRILQFVESALTHPTHTDGFVDKGDPVLVGDIVGVARDSATAATDQIAIETGGIHSFNVVASDAAGTRAVAVGDSLYINQSTAIISKDGSGRFFGYALTALDASATAAVCVVQVGPGKTIGQDEFTVSVGPFAAADVAKTVFVADKACELVKATVRWGTKAGQAGTLTLEKCVTGEAAAAGDVMLAAGFDLTGDNDTTVDDDPVSDGKEILAAGDAIRMKLASGAATSLADASLTLTLKLM